MAKRNLMGILVIALVFGMMVVGCGGGDDDIGKTPLYVPPQPTPLTGTVTVSSNITLESSKEKMTLTADITESNASSFSYQWQRDGVNISGASSKTYVVVEADYGKTLKVNVAASSSWYSGEQSGQITVPNPTIMNVSVKYDSTTSSNASRRKGVIFETESGRQLGFTSETLGTTAQTVTISSWQENNPSWKVNKFKIKFNNGLLSAYFKKTGTTDELFDLVNGSKTYILTFTTTGSIDYDFFATEEDF